MGNGNRCLFREMMRNWATTNPEWVAQALVAFARDAAIGKNQTVYGKMIHHQGHGIWLPNMTVVSRVRVREDNVEMKLHPEGEVVKMNIDIFRVPACSYGGAGYESPPAPGTYWRKVRTQEEEDDSEEDSDETFDAPSTQEGQDESSQDSLEDM